MNEETRYGGRPTSRPARPRRRSRAGFTLVEIMIVVMIIGVLLNVAAPAMVHARDSGQARACVANLHNIYMAKEEWALQNNIDPSTTPAWSDITQYVKPGTQPTCPTTGVVLNINALNQLPTCPSYPNGPTGQPQLAHAIH